MTLFTVHIPVGARDPERIAEQVRVVPEKASFAAFLFGPVWLAAQGAWWAAGGFALAMGALLGAQMALDLSAGGLLATLLVIQLFIGLEGHQFARAAAKEHRCAGAAEYVRRQLGPRAVRRRAGQHRADALYAFLGAAASVHDVVAFGIELRQLAEVMFSRMHALQRDLRLATRFCKLRKDRRRRREEAAVESQRARARNHGVLDAVGRAAERMQRTAEFENETPRVLGRCGSRGCLGRIHPRRNGGGKRRAAQMQSTATASGSVRAGSSRGVARQAPVTRFQPRPQRNRKNHEANTTVPANNIKATSGSMDRPKLDAERGRMLL